MNQPIALDPGVLAGFASARTRMTQALGDPVFEAEIRAALEPDTAPVAAPAPSAPEAHPSLLAPADWDSYHGQEEVKAQLRVRIHSARTRNAPLEPTLLTGPGGAGKTALAQLIAVELGRPLKVLTKPVRTDALIDLLWNFSGVLFVDEIHQWGARTSNGGQHALMQLIEDGTLDNAMGTKVALRGLSIIAATTNMERLFPPLLSRFMVQCEYDEYSDAEMSDIVGSMSTQMEGYSPMTWQTCCELGRAAAGSPRAARSLVLAARDLHASGLPIDTATILAMTGTDPDGLTKAHRRYLTRLAAAPNGRAGLTTMSTLTGLPTGQLVAVEALLARRGFIVMGPSGRQITTTGRYRAVA